jgi:CDGSH-type Zn-finger protein/truncated hemoglobin YjbI
MANGSGHDSFSSAGGQGQLARLIAMRGGLASPESPFVIEHREALIYMLCEAAELEHGIMCQYLFAAFSLKQGTSEGLTGDEAAAVSRWRQRVSHVATQEMLHLALVQNLLSAIGAAPHLARPNLPQPANHYPAGVQLALLPFGEQALRHFMFLERPEGMDLQDASGLAASGRAQPLLSERDIVPRGQDFATVGHLYRSIEAGLAHLAELHGEDWLFVGPPRAQATTEHFSWPELIPVIDLASAQRAIDEILEQGEGSRGNWQDAHFGQFVEILDEYQQLRSANPAFEPVRPVMAANVRPHEGDAEVPLISDLLTARITDLFNVSYEILLQILERFFAHTQESDAQLKILADTTIGLMFRVLKPLGDLITLLPVGEEHAGMTVGPSFELFYENDYLMPHRDAAWALLAERLSEASWLCSEIQAGKGRRLASQLDPVLAALREMARSLAAQLPAGSAHARLATVPGCLEAGQLDDLLRRARELADRAAGAANPAVGASVAGQPAGELDGLFKAAYEIVTSDASGAGCSPEDQALIMPRMVDSVLRPLADAMSDSSAQVTSVPAAGPADAAAPGQPEVTAATRVWDVAKSATTACTRMGQAGDRPPGLAEAVAALQDLACRLAPPGEADARRAELWQLQAGSPAAVQASRNGPYLVTGVPRLIDHLGTETRPVPQLALCRCGNSAMKPLCDGSHARIGFTEVKDPKRVPDRRDTYPGQQLAIFDNRGACQHSGLCTDRLASVFRTGQEPFVAPSGGRMDEIVRAVRDCPSGALSYAIDGTEARAQVDWGGTREPAIMVTKDGPYRITGEIPLTKAAGQPEERAKGTSLEHYALCRCGHSQNKPFCSGMHWYVGFRDPVLPPGAVPTPYEWAGGRPALIRMSRLLYEKHVPADPLLASLCAAMPADQPQRLAGWLAAHLGGPGPAPDASLQPVITGAAGGLDEQQRARWVALTNIAADEAGLPADPQFRSVLSSCLDWVSRTALAQVRHGQAQSGTAVRFSAPTPRWDWGPGGPPAADIAADDARESVSEEALPRPGQPVGFAAHIRPLFRQHDRQSMSFAFDLWSYDDVRAHAADIARRLTDGSMPCDGAWPEARTEAFQRWIDSGLQP